MKVSTGSQRPKETTGCETTRPSQWKPMQNTARFFLFCILIWTYLDFWSVKNDSNFDSVFHLLTVQNVFSPDWLSQQDDLSADYLNSRLHFKAYIIAGSMRCMSIYQRKLTLFMSFSTLHTRAVSDYKKQWSSTKWGFLKILQFKIVGVS